MSVLYEVCRRDLCWQVSVTGVCVGVVLYEVCCDSCWQVSVTGVCVGVGVV